MNCLLCLGESIPDDKACAKALGPYLPSHKCLRAPGGKGREEEGKGVLREKSNGTQPEPGGGAQRDRVYGDAMTPVGRI